MNSNEILNELKRIKNLRFDSQLAVLLKVNHSQITRWRKEGFHKSTKKTLTLIINEYIDLEKKLKKVNKKLDRL